jgi:KDO2-lipid IV(A) lauroyltransferase
MPAKYRRPRRKLKTALDWVIAQCAFLLLGLLRRIPARAATGFVARASRIIGPLVPRNRLAEQNLKLAFPEKEAAERRDIRLGMWESLGRTVIEYVHLDALTEIDLDNPGKGMVDVVGIEQFHKLRESGTPAILFTGHLANWELLPVCAAKYELKVASLFRAPNNRFIAERLMEVRKDVMGELIASRPGAVYDLMKRLENGSNIGLLVDQKFWHGIKVSFFGHPATVNPLLGKLARKYDCPVHGARTVRLPDGRFRLEITEALDLPRDADGHVNVSQTMHLVTAVVEGWIREHPEQWLWAHRRWANR